MFPRRSLSGSVLRLLVFPAGHFDAGRFDSGNYFSSIGPCSIPDAPLGRLASLPLLLNAEPRMSSPIYPYRVSRSAPVPAPAGDANSAATATRTIAGDPLPGPIPLRGSFGRPPQIERGAR